MLILGSKSKARYHLLKLYNSEIEVIASNTKEEFDASKSVYENVMQIARAKANDILSKKQLQSEDVLLCADTIVVNNGLPLFKPNSYEDAFKMIKNLSNKKVEVITGVFLKSQYFEHSFFEVTTINFQEISNVVINDYLAHANYMEIAGALSIELIKDYVEYEIHGSLSNVIGLPMDRITVLLYDHNMESKVSCVKGIIRPIDLYRSSVRVFPILNNKIGLIKRYTLDKSEIFYTTVGGGYSFFEDKHSTVKKEAEEEAGLLLEDIVYLDSIKDYALVSRDGIVLERASIHSYYKANVIGNCKTNYIDYEKDVFIGLNFFTLDEAIALYEVQISKISDFEDIRFMSECDLHILKSIKR